MAFGKHSYQREAVNSPLQIPGCIGWWRPDRGLTTHGTNGVVQWNDLSGFNNHLTASSVIEDCQYLAGGGPNGQDTVYFTGNSQLVLSAANDTHNTSRNQLRPNFLTFVAVCNFPSLPGGNLDTLLSQNNQVTFILDGYGLVSSASNKLTWFINNVNTNRVQTTGSLQIHQTWVFECTYDGSQLELILNGVSQGTSAYASSSGVFYGNATWDVGHAGSRPFLAMSCSELILYDNALTPDRRKKLEYGYLAPRYGNIFP